MIIKKIYSTYQSHHFLKQAIPIYSHYWDSQFYHIARPLMPLILAFVTLILDIVRLSKGFMCPTVLDPPVIGVIQFFVKKIRGGWGFRCVLGG